MKNVEKTMREDKEKRETVLKILEMFNGESIDDAKETLDIVKYYLGANCYFDYELAKDLIGLAEGD